MKLLETLNEVIVRDGQGNTIGVKMVKDTVTIQTNQGGLLSSVKLTVMEFYDFINVLDRKMWKEKQK